MGSNPAAPTIQALCRKRVFRSGHVVHSYAYNGTERPITAPNGTEAPTKLPTLLQAWLFGTALLGAVRFVWRPMGEADRIEGALGTLIVTAQSVLT